MTLTESTETATVLEITEIALDQIIELRDAEAIDGLTLGVRIAGVGQNGFVYETAFIRPEDVGEDDHREEHGDLPVAIPPDSVDNLRGSVLDLGGASDAPGLVLRNPNPPTPADGGLDLGDLELTGTVEERIAELLDKAINPAIASHGGVAKLDHVEGDTAFLVLGGGCQGCGLAAMTLRQGIETAIQEHIPEIAHVEDATDHSAGVNPYY